MKSAPKSTTTRNAQEMSRTSDADRYPQLRSYGRRKGKKLHRRRRTAYEQVLPGVAVALPTPSEKNIDPSALFPFPVRDTWLEIGFGDGQQLAHLALQHPDIGLIGCEPFIN